MIIQNLINEIEREQKTEKEQNERGKIRIKEFKQMFYKTLYDLETADKNLKECVGK
jgi:hypothetical protein